MLRFEADGSGSAEHHGTWQVEGFRAAAPLVVVVEGGSLWVLDQQGGRYALNAPGVVAWEAGEWVAYGSEGPVTFKDYWAPRVSEAGFHPCGPVDAPKGVPPEWADS